jgi:predicted RNA-binding protein with PIN domain
MIILIDAYNLLHAFPSHAKTLTDSKRAQFIKRLSRYGRIKKHSMVLVFDGGLNQWPSTDKIHEVQIIYSGTRFSADDCIKQYLSEHCTKDILLVSSDRELNDFAQRLNIPSIDSPAFYYILQEAVQQSNKTNRSAGDFVKMVRKEENEKESGPQHDIDALMMEASKILPVKSEDVVQDDRREKSKQVSKQERILLKKLHKL